MAKITLYREQNLEGVHPDLVKVVRRAAEISKLPITVLEGVRTAARQRQLVAAGASQILKSRHLTGHAVDLCVVVGRQCRWDWPTVQGVADAMKAAAAELGVPIVWGGDWKRFRDGPHFELRREEYPA